MEFVRMGVVYIHLIACCVAISRVLSSDISMVRRLFDTDPGTIHDQSHLPELQRSVTLALAALWITGIAIISLDGWSQGLLYFMNPKLQAKIGIVLLLTLNGAVLHTSVLPAMQKAGSLLNLPLQARMAAIFAGVISAVSWFFAAMLGIGRPLNWKYSLFEILAAFPVLIAFGFVTMLLITALAKSRARQARWTAGQAELVLGT